nr:anaerobic sulfatase maturase [uncultured Cohaesibacter sp.]
MAKGKSAVKGIARMPYHLMAKPTGFRCNIACDYCFYLEKAKGSLRPGNDQRVMDDQTLEAYIRAYIRTNPLEEIEFSWQGGEPTLAGIGFFEKALTLQRQYAAGKKILNSIQTNGLLIDDDWARFLARNNFLVGLSLDGPAALHDTHRMANNGKGVHHLVLRALEHLKRHKVETNILCVVNATTASQPEEIYHYLTGELGMRFIQFIPAVEQRSPDNPTGELLHPQNEEQGAALTPWSVSGKAYGAFICAIFDIWVRSDVGKVFVQLFDNTLAAWLGQKPALCVMQPTCGQNLVIEMNGDIYSCDHYVYPENRLGNVRSDDLATLVDSKAQRSFATAKAKFPHVCAQCEWRFTCQGGCPKHRIHRQGSHWHNHLCDGYQAMFGHMAPYMTFMADQIRNQRPPSTVMSAVSTIRQKGVEGKNSPEKDWPGKNWPEKKKQDKNFIAELRAP